MEKDVQLARIARRQETAPHETFPMTEAHVDEWRKQFQVPDAAELDGDDIPDPPAGWPAGQSGRQTNGRRALTVDGDTG